MFGYLGNGVNRRCGYAGNGVSRAGVVVTLAKGKQNVSACIFDVETSCACALEPRIYNDCGNWSGPSTGLDSVSVCYLFCFFM